jgi:hypothetical protein
MVRRMSEIERIKGQLDEAFQKRWSIEFLPVAMPVTPLLVCVQADLRVRLEGMEVTRGGMGLAVSSGTEPHALAAACRAAFLDALRSCAALVLPAEPATTAQAPEEIAEPDDRPAAPPPEEFVPPPVEAPAAPSLSLFEQMQREIAQCDTLADCEGWVQVRVSDAQGLPPEQTQAIRSLLLQRKADLRAMSPRAAVIVRAIGEATTTKELQAYLETVSSEVRAMPDGDRSKIRAVATQKKRDLYEAE